jgi:hypothetical protein
MRKQLIDALEDLLGDEYDANDLVRLSEGELIQQLINVAFYFKDQSQNED